LAIYNSLVKYCKEDDASDEICNTNLTAFEKEQLEITTESDLIIEGRRPANSDELKVANEFLNEGEEFTAGHNDSLRIPDYWLICFKNKKIFISEQDELILKHITNVDIQSTNNVDNKEELTTTLILKFSDNEFFANKELKVAIMGKSGEPEKSTADKIEWKDGKDPTVKTVSKKQKSKKTGKTRTVEKKERQRSFFELFSNLTADDFEDIGMDVDMDQISSLDKTNVWE